MPIVTDSPLEITAYDWAPGFARGLVRDLRPRWACEEIGLEYRERLISAMDRPAWYYEEQPWGQVPYLRDGDVHLFESAAMLIHLGEKTGALLPATGQPRADVLSWLLASANSVEPMLGELNAITIFAAEEEWAKLRRPSLLAALEKRLIPVARHLEMHEWLASAFSIADIAMTTTLRSISAAGQLARHASLVAYLARNEARPAFQRALADQLAAFDAPPAQPGGPSA